MAQEVPRGASGSESPPKVRFWLALGVAPALTGRVCKVHLSGLAFNYSLLVKCVARWTLLFGIGKANRISCSHLNRLLR